MSGAPSLAAASAPPAGESLSREAARNAVAGLGARLVALAAGLVLTPFVLHGIGRDLFGVAAVAGSTLEYLWLMRGGLGTAMRRYVTVSFHAGDRTLAERYYATGFWWTSLLRLVVVVAGVGLAGALCRFMRLEPGLVADATAGLVLLFIAAGLGDLGGILEVPTYATGRTAPVSALRAGGALVKLGLVAAAFGLLAPSLTVYTAAAGVGDLLVVVAIGLWSARARVVSSVVPRPDFGTPELRRTLFQFGSFAMVSQVASILYLATDNLLIGRLYGPARVTEYSLGTRWAPMITALLWAGVSALTPLVTRLEARGELERTRQLVLRASAVNAALAVPMCLVPCVIGDLFLAQWVGPEYRRSAAYLVAMLVPMLISLTLEPMWMALVARGRIGRIASADIVVAVANPLVSLVLALPFGLGLLGFALGNTLALLAKNLLLRPFMGRADEALPPVRVALRPLPAALAGGAPALLALGLARPLVAHSLTAVIAVGLAAGVLCLAGSTMAAVGWKETRRIAGALMGRRS